MVCIRLLTCSKALAVYVTKMPGNVPSFTAFLNTSEGNGVHFSCYFHNEA